METQKLNKTYCVHIAVINRNGDNRNWSSRTLIAPDAEKAIVLTKPGLKRGEYIESVELVVVLDS